MADQAAALANVVVLNLMRGEAGATTSFYLAQLGARVILVEPQWGVPLRAQAQALPRGAAFWSSWHANQESMAVDFDSVAGKERVLRLVEEVDILLEDSPAEVEDLGLSYERVAKLKPSLVYGSMRSWASEQFFNGRESEVMLQAIAGFMAQTGHPDGPPLRSGGHYVAGLSGAHLAIGVMAAVFEARRTLKGQHVRVVQQEVGMSASPSAFQENAEFEEKTRFAGDNKTGGTPSGLFRTKPFGPDDWCHIYIAANAADRWEGFVRAIGREDLLSDPDYATAQGRTKKTREINALAAAWCAERTKAEVMLILGPAGIPVGAMNSTEDILGFDHVQASGMFDPVDSAQGPVPVPALPLQLSASRVPIRRGPELGEHTQAILDWLSRRDQAAAEKGSSRHVKGPLGGITVCDFSQGLAGPTATYPLAQLGARVIKIERNQPREGRGTPLRGPSLELEAAATQGGKESIAIDLRHPDGKEVAKRLIARSDVVVENFGPGVIDRLGLGYETVRQVNPRAIFASLKGFNAECPWSEFNALDPVIQAACGATSVTGEMDNPRRPHPPLADIPTGITLCTGVLAALVQRESTGVGQRVFVSMLDNGIHYARHPYARFIASGAKPERRGNMPPDPIDMEFAEAFRCAGGGMNDYCIVEIDSDDEWRAVATATGVRALGWDPRFQTRELRRQNTVAISAALAPWFATRSKQEAMQTLLQAAVRAAAVLTPYDVMQQQDQLLAEDTLADIVVGDGTSKTLAWPVKFSNFRAPLRTGPSPGQHTDEVLHNLLGYSTEQIATLRDTHVI